MMHARRWKLILCYFELW
uniref:Uncharacterized protein n=1 Tax=Anguilla anguilla TaxID=7936 RepID=A0A0E9QKQ2_ANGAN